MAYSRIHEILQDIEDEWDAELGSKVFANLKKLLDVSGSLLWFADVKRDPSSAVHVHARG